jgi:hypothetical protein
MRSVDHAGDRTEDSSGLSGSSETTYSELATIRPELGNSFCLCVVAFTQLSPKRYLSLGTIDTSSPDNSRGRCGHKFKGIGEREGVAAPGRYIYYSASISVAISESLRWLALSSE